MPRRKDTVDAHEGAVLALGFRPFSTDNLELFETIVSPIDCSADELAELIEGINLACRNWALHRRMEVEPTLRQRQDWYQQLAKQAFELLELLGEDFQVEKQVPVTEPEQPLPTAMIYDEGYVRRARSNPILPAMLPEDPTASADGSLPWPLARLRDAYEARYFGKPPQPRAFHFGNEAMLEIGPLLDALAFAAQSEAERLKHEATSPDSDAKGKP